MRRAHLVTAGGKVGGHRRITRAAFLVLGGRKAAMWTVRNVCSTTSTVRGKCSTYGAGSEGTQKAKSAVHAFGAGRVMRRLPAVARHPDRGPWPGQGVHHRPGAASTCRADGSP